MKSIIFLVSVLLIVSCSDTSNNTTISNNTTDSSIEQKSTNKQINNNELVESSGELKEDEMTNMESESKEVQQNGIKNLETVTLDKNNASTSPKETEQKNALNKNEVATKSADVKKEAESALQSTSVPLKPSHDNWNVLLKKNVSSSGKVNYSGMKSGIADLEAYVTYLQSFTTQDSWTRNEKLAYWINLYNAATVKLIVQNYPISSITKLSGGKPWDQNIVKIGTKNYTLNDIENKVIRPRFKDGRIHFAVNCAAKSCPPLMNSAFTASSLNRQLEKQTAAFINSPENSLSADKVEISKIFDWYKVDFEGGDVISFLNKYSETPINSDATITYKEYNWDLNK